MSIQIPSQEFVIDYSLAKVKSAINVFINDLSLQPHGYYKNTQNTNDMFNIYAFNIWKSDFIAGMVTGDMNVTLQDINGKQTKVTIKSIAKTNGPLDNSRILDIQSDFLNKLTQSLKGEYVSVPKELSNNPGCLGVVLVIIISSIIAYIIF